jgi:hypothetical protein
MSIVHDFVKDVDRRTLDLQGSLDGIYRHVNTRAEPARVCQQNLHADDRLSGAKSSAPTLMGPRQTPLIADFTRFS